MKLILKIVVVLLVIGFIGIQFVRPGHTNPPVNPADTMENSTAVPPEVASILGRSCADCHSSDTHFPWYSQVAPVSWWLNNHINEGRRELNISQWNTYNDKKKGRKLGEICEQVQQGEMPLPSYLWIHRDAALSEADVKTLCDWTASERSKYPE
jgi:hypothetical protein